MIIENITHLGSFKHFVFVKGSLCLSICVCICQGVVNIVNFTQIIHRSSVEDFMEIELMWRPTDQQGEYRAICLYKVGRQSFAEEFVLRSPSKDFYGIIWGPCDNQELNKLWGEQHVCTSRENSDMASPKVVDYFQRSRHNCEVFEKGWCLIARWSGRLSVPVLNVHKIFEHSTLVQFCRYLDRIYRCT